MKINLKISLLVLTAVLLVSTQALATGINFIGPSFSIFDTDGDLFSDRLELGTALVTMANPTTDPIFGDAGFETIQFSPLFLDPTNYNPGVSYHFNPSTTPGGFRVFDDDGTSLFWADLTTPTLNILGQTGSISPYLNLNLTNITASSSYLGNSPIIDSFLNAPGGDITITLQLAGINFNGIENGDTLLGTYSGSASPLHHTPEPATMLLLGTGLIGIASLGRKRFLKKK